jgi:hypothetical protein
MAADRVYALTGDSRAKAAASQCRARRIGRPSIDDSAALNRAMFAIETGDARSAEDAAGLVGAALGMDLCATFRLAKKLRRQIVQLKG